MKARLVLLVLLASVFACTSSVPSTSSSSSGGQPLRYAPAVNIRIVAIGDSHTNGKVPSALDANGNSIGIWGINGPHDWQWTGAGTFRGGNTGTPYYAESQLSTAVASAPDLWPVVTTGLQSWLSWLPNVLHLYSNVRDVYTANFGVANASTYTWSGATSHTYVGGLLQALDGDTVTVCGQTYTFRTSPAVPFDVLIAGTVEASQTNLENAVNAEGTGWFAGTTPNTSCFCSFPFGSQGPYSIYNSLSTGTAGNSLTVASSNLVRITAIDPTSITPVSPSTMIGGSATSAWWSNMQSILALGGGFGTPDVVFILLGTNDCYRAGYRGRTYSTEMAKLIAQVHGVWARAQVILWKPPVSTLASPWSSCIATLNASVASLAAANPSYVSFVDYNVLGVGGTGPGPVYFLGGDGIHLTNYGYQTLAQMGGGKIGALMGLQ